MALQWVYDNIEAFNGDREKITLFGPGAGGASAGLLMVAPRTRQLVNKVIAQVCHSNFMMMIIFERKICVVAGIRTTDLQLKIFISDVHIDDNF